MNQGRLPWQAKYYYTMWFLFYHVVFTLPWYLFYHVVFALSCGIYFTMCDLLYLVVFALLCVICRTVWYLHALPMMFYLLYHMVFALPCFICFTKGMWYLLRHVVFTFINMWHFVRVAFVVSCSSSPFWCFFSSVCLFEVLS